MEGAAKRALRLDTASYDAAGHMALDEAVLDSAEPGCCYFRHYRWAGRAPHGATFGYFIPWALAESRVQGRYPGGDVPMVRRPTGGGVVFHDGDLTFSFVFPWPEPLTPALVYKSIHLGVQAGLKTCGLASRLWTRREAQAPRVSCFEGPEPMDLTHADGGKFLGGALRRRRGVGLYQGSLRPEGFSAPRGVLRRAMEEGVALQWRVRLRACEPGPRTTALAGRLERERYRTEEWNRKR